MTRRRFLALAAVGSASARALVGRALAAPATPRAAGGRPLREFRRSAAPTEIDFGPLGRRTIWTYELDAEPAGSHLYHSHQGLQIDRGLVGALVIEERSPHIAYDRDYTLVLDDLLTGDPPEMTSAQGDRSSRGRMGGGMMRGMGGGGMMGGWGAGRWKAVGWAR